jgi:molybdopterin-guanine dinucleotide biosynthesis protein
LRAMGEGNAGGWNCRSEVGRTQLIEKFLGTFPGASVLKVTLGEHPVEARIVTSEEELRTPGKDTWRYLNAGAGSVVWVSSRREDLAELLPRALSVFDPGLLFVESNAAVRMMDPAVVIFVEGEADPNAAGRGSPKEGALEIRARADYITSEPFENLNQMVSGIREVIGMSEEQARELITKRAKEGRLPCAAAFRIAEQSGVPKKRIGQILNEMNVRIVTCQLGCFP